MESLFRGKITDEDDNKIVIEIFDENVLLHLHKISIVDFQIAYCLIYRGTERQIDRQIYIYIQ